VWLDFSDLFSDFATSEASIRTGVARWTATRQSHRLARQERDLASRATVITTAGWSDGEALQATSGRSVTWIPTPVAPPIPTSSTSPRDDPPVAGFLANFEYWPNRDALDVLVGTWAPRLVAIGWRVLVAGRGSDALALPDGVDNLGPVPSIDDFYRRVDATVAPIRIGGGMKVKVIESLVHGTPVIATAHAVEGFPPEIQRLAVTVDVDEPDFETVRHGPPPAPVLSPDLYEPFSTAGFRRRVSLALEDVTGR
jgi:polysaccharide biosynthesis protein PslH